MDRAATIRKKNWRSRQPAPPRYRRIQEGHRLLTTPGFRRMAVFRRLIAVMLLGAAALLALHPGDGDLRDVVVFRRQLAAGAVITAEDLDTRKLPSQAVPKEAVSDPAVLIGQVLSAGVYPNEYATDLRFVGPRLAGALSGAEPTDVESTLVPLSLANPELAEVLNPGDRVSVIAARDRKLGDNNSDPEGTQPGGEEQEADVIARGGLVVLSDGEPGTIVIALDAPAAHAVAAASLRGPLSVVISGTGL